MPARRRMRVSQDYGCNNVAEGRLEARGNGRHTVAPVRSSSYPSSRHVPRTAVGFCDVLVERVEGAPGLLSSGYAARDDEGSCAVGELRPNFEGRGLAVALEVGFEVDDLSREPVRALIARHLEGMF